MTYNQTDASGDAPGPSSAVPSCPIVNGQPFDPMSAAQAENPHPWLSAARELSPVFALTNETDYVIDYELQLQVLGDADTFSSAQLVNFEALPETFSAIFPDGPPMVLLDEPAHLRLRRLAQAAFSPKLVEAREDSIRALARDLLAKVVQEKTCDLVTTLASRLPVLAIVDLVGAPLDRAAEFGQWAHDRAVLLSVLQGAPPPGPAETAEVIERATSFTRYLTAFVEERRAAPRDDLTSHLILAESEPGEPALSTTEVVGVIASILSAGTSTTANFIPTAVYHLLRNGIWASMEENPSRIGLAVEESLRLWSSVRGVSRSATRDVELGGCPIAGGAHVYLHLGAANRDPAVFPDPDVFDIGRENAHRHVAFGRYKHLCLGAPLARLETRIAIELMVDMLPGLRLAGGWSAEWIPSTFTPGLRDLVLAWD